MFESVRESRNVHRTRRVALGTRQVDAAISQIFVYNIFYGLCGFSLLLILQKINRSRGKGASRDQGDFPWINFPQIGSKATLVRWRRKLETLKKKDFY